MICTSPSRAKRTVTKKFKKVCVLPLLHIHCLHHADLSMHGVSHNVN